MPSSMQHKLVLYNKHINSTSVQLHLNMYKHKSIICLRRILMRRHLPKWLYVQRSDDNDDYNFKLYHQVLQQSILCCKLVLYKYHNRHLCVQKKRCQCVVCMPFSMRYCGVHPKPRLCNFVRSNIYLLLPGQILSDKQHVHRRFDNNIHH